MSNPFDNDNGGPGAIINPFDDTSTHVGEETSCPEEAVDNAAQVEASWQYLGDLPYRRIPIYANVRWEGGGGDSGAGGRLSYYPPELRNKPRQKFMGSDHRTYLSKTTVTKCVGCPNGGPIALMTLPLTNGAMVSTKLRILTNSGKPLAVKDFPMDGLPTTGLPTTTTKSSYSPFDVLALGFTDRCTLVIVLKDSLCITLNFNGDFVLEPFHVFGEPTELKLAQIYEGGVAVLASNRQTAIVELLDEHDENNDYAPHPSATRIGKYSIATILPTADRSTHYCALAVLPRTRTAHRHPEVFVSTTDLSVLSINVGTLEVVDLQARLESPIVDMAFAPNGRFLACFTESSTLTVISTNFETKVLDFDTSEGSNRSPPLSMEWCGEDSVVLHWKNLGLLMVGPYGDWLRFPYESTENVFLISEIDCCRVITDTAVELLQRVPPATASLLSIGSIDTTAMLLDAADAYHAGSPTSDEATRSMLEGGMLDESVETCMDSATKEFDIDTQKRLLRAATYGMHFGFKKADSALGGPVTGSSPHSGILPSKTACNFVQAARKLRILNALRNPNVGFVLTSGQFDAMTATGVVARLVAMKRAALAAEISKYFGLPKSVQLFARASKASSFIKAVNNRLSDSETAERAIQILNGNETSASMNRGGYAAVAMTARDRPGVANLLLMMETSVADKVPALVSTGSYADAIAVATSARDADFIFSTLMEYQTSVMLNVTPEQHARAHGSFLSTVVAKFTPESFNMLRRYFEAKGDSKSLTALFLKSQQPADAGNVLSIRGFFEQDFREQQGMLSEASRIYATGKDTVFHKATTEDYLELIKDQETLRNKYGSPDVAPPSSSVVSTISAVLKFAGTPIGSREQHRLLHDAEKLSRKFRLSEKRFWHVRVNAFSESEQWSNLRSMLENNRRPPIGYKPFARAAIRGNRPQSEILRYIDPVNIPEERYDLLCEASLWKKALSIAEGLRDARRVLNVKSLCNDPSLQLHADTIMARLA